MDAKPTLRIVAATIGFALSASAQMDADKFAADLWANFGSPTKREVFTIPAGEMVVDYAATGHVCRIELPPVAPDEQHAGVSSGKAMDEFLLKLVPLSMRGKEGKELGKMTVLHSALRISSVQYENVTISETFQGSMRTGVTVVFTKEQCQNHGSQ